MIWWIGGLIRYFGLYFYYIIAQYGFTLRIECFIRGIKNLRGFFGVWISIAMIYNFAIDILMPYFGDPDHFMRCKFLMRFNYFNQQ